jgi:hypothetical protein
MPVTPLLRDMDMDGDTDIFRYTYGDFQINLNSGLGSFGPDISYYLGSDYIPSGVALADMDGDGDPDYVWSHGNMGGGGTDSVFWCPNLGGGVPGANVFAGLSPVQTHNDLGAQNSPVLRSADLNNDGLEDLVVFAGDSIGVLRNGGSGSFLPGQALPATDTYALDIGDLDLDGLPDLVALRQNGDLLFRQNTGGALFGPASLIATSADHTGTDDVRLADMDGDGILDVVTCSTNGSAAWLGNNGFPVGWAEHSRDEAFDIRVYILRARPARTPCGIRRAWPCSTHPTRERRPRNGSPSRFASGRAVPSARSARGAPFRGRARGGVLACVGLWCHQP